MFVFHHFLPQKQAFLSPEKCPRDKRGAKLIFCTLLILIAKTSYLTVIQRVSKGFVLKIIDLH